jgi:hypothetical protein
MRHQTGHIIAILKPSNFCLQISYQSADMYWDQLFRVQRALNGIVQSSSPALWSFHEIRCVNIMDLLRWGSRPLRISSKYLRMRNLAIQLKYSRRFKRSTINSETRIWDAWVVYQDYSTSESWNMFDWVGYGPVTPATFVCPLIDCQSLGHGLFRTTNAQTRVQLRLEYIEQDHSSARFLRCLQNAVDNWINPEQWRRDGFATGVGAEGGGQAPIRGPVSGNNSTYLL